MAYRAIVFQLGLLVALQLRHGVGVAVVNRSVAGLPQLTVRAATHFQLGLQTVSPEPIGQADAFYVLHVCGYIIASQATPRD